MSDGWAKEAVDKLRRRNESKREQAENLRERNKLRTEQGPGLWDELRHELGKRVQEFNSEYGQKAVTIIDQTSHSLHMRFAEGDVCVDLFAEFAPTSAKNALHWRYEGGLAPEESRSLSSNDAGMVIFYSGMTPTTPASIATQMINGLLLVAG